MCVCAPPGDVGHDAVEEVVLVDNRGLSVRARAATLDTGTANCMLQLSY